MVTGGAIPIPRGHSLLQVKKIHARTSFPGVFPVLIVVRMTHKENSFDTALIQNQSNQSIGQKKGADWLLF